MTPVTTGVPPSTVAGSPGRVAQGPFGGTGDNSLCDRELLVEFLTTPANAAIAREWARVLDIRVEDIPTYVRALIPTTLTGDTRVTNHRWENGRAVGYQAVLERGTAVLVDVDGRLIARCRCGNPLLPPQEIARPVYTGPQWDGFDPTVIVVVVPSPTPIYPPGGVGTLPPGTTPTTPTTRGTTTTTRGTTPSTVPDDIAAEAVSLVRNPLEACLRTEYAKYGFDPEETIGDLRYSASLLDLRTGMFRVVVSNLEGESATWDVSLRTGDVTPVDANAQDTVAYCPALA
jgi:hypothetical protein